MTRAEVKAGEQAVFYVAARQGTAGEAVLKEMLSLGDEPLRFSVDRTQHWSPNGHGVIVSKARVDFTFERDDRDVVFVITHGDEGPLGVIEGEGRRCLFLEETAGGRAFTLVPAHSRGRVIYLPIGPRVADKKGMPLRVAQSILLHWVGLGRGWINRDGETFDWPYGREPKIQRGVHWTKGLC